MMVVIGIIAILSAVVVPGFKKIYGDFKIRETYDLIDTILSANRSFYLIFNEYPSGSDVPIYGLVDAKMAPFLPAFWVNPSQKWIAANGKEFWELNPGNSLYLFNVIRAMANGIYLTYNDRRMSQYCIPYYLDDLRARYIKKGCSIQDGSVGGNNLLRIFIIFPNIK